MDVYLYTYELVAWCATGKRLDACSSVRAFHGPVYLMDVYLCTHESVAWCATYR